MPGRPPDESFYDTSGAFIERYNVWRPLPPGRLCINLASLALLRGDERSDNPLSSSKTAASKAASSSVGTTTENEREMMDSVHQDLAEMDDAEVLIETIHLTLNICSSDNIKLCKDLIIKICFSSLARYKRLMKALITISMTNTSHSLDAKSVVNAGLSKTSGSGQLSPPAPAFRRLHALYLCHDLLMHIWNHKGTVSLGEAHGDKWTALQESYMTASTLAQLAVCGGPSGAHSKVREPVFAVFKTWQDSGFATSTQVEAEKQKVLEAEKTDWTTLTAKIERQIKQAEENLKKENTIQNGQFPKLPYRHSKPKDPEAPWYDLPATNGLLMRRQHGYPLRASMFPRGGFPVENGGSEPDDELKAHVSKIYNDMMRCFDKYTNPDEVQDVDALGNIIWKDPERATRNYYGFSLEGIEKKKELEKEFARNAEGYPDHTDQVRDAAERARALAGRGGGMRGRGGRGGYRGRGAY